MVERVNGISIVEVKNRTKLCDSLESFQRFANTLQSAKQEHQEPINQIALLETLLDQLAVGALQQGSMQQTTQPVATAPQAERTPQQTASDMLRASSATMHRTSADLVSTLKNLSTFGKDVEALQNAFTGVGAVLEALAAMQGQAAVEQAKQTVRANSSYLTSEAKQKVTKQLAALQELPKYVEQYKTAKRSTPVTDAPLSDRFWTLLGRKRSLGDEDAEVTEGYNELVEKYGLGR